jgi:WD40 repeat protein
MLFIQERFEIRISIKFTLIYCYSLCQPKLFAYEYIIILNKLFVINSNTSRNIPCALLSITSCPEQTLFAAGSYNKTVYVFDSRSGHMPIRHYKAHSRAVIKMTMNSEYIISVSDDKTMTVWDQRTRRIMKSITVIFHFFSIANIRYIIQLRCRKCFSDFKRSVPYVHKHATGFDLSRR